MTALPPLESIEKVLVRGVNWVGDTVLTLPTIEGIRQLMPAAKLSLLIKDNLCSLFRSSPWVDELIPFRQVQGLMVVSEEARLCAEIKRSGYDLAIILPRSLRAALLPWRAGIRYRIGYACNGRGVLFTHALRESDVPAQCHQADYYYRLVQFLGVREVRPLPRLFIGEEEHAWAQSFYDAAGVARDDVIIAINPGSTYGPAKCWPVVKYIELARRLISSRNRLLLVGGKDNAELIDYMYLSLKCRAMRAVGEDLLRLGALLTRCDLLITNDTGPMHLAASVETPVIAIFGSTDPRTTSPLGLGHRLFRKETECSPCLKRRCPYDHRCMEAIAADEVEAAVYEQLSVPGGMRQNTISLLSPTGNETRP